MAAAMTTPAAAQPVHRAVQLHVSLTHSPRPGAMIQPLLSAAVNSPMARAGRVPARFTTAVVRNGSESISPTAHSTVQGTATQAP